MKEKEPCTTYPSINGKNNCSAAISVAGKMEWLQLSVVVKYTPESVSGKSVLASVGEKKSPVSLSVGGKGVCVHQQTSDHPFVYLDPFDNKSPL